jgi:uncharacterized protein with LGFP repeats
MRPVSKRMKILLFLVFIVAAWPAAAYQVYGAIGEKWLALGAESGILGAPNSDEVDSPNGGRFQSFERGYVIWSPSTGAHTMFGSIYEKWKSLGGVSAYGFPITDESPGARGGRFNDFNRGNSIYWSTPTGAHAVYGFIRNKWKELGGDNSFLRYPTTDELPAANGGRMSGFEGGVIYWHPKFGAHTVYGRILEEWNLRGREAGVCGYPTTDEDIGRAGGLDQKNPKFRRLSFVNGDIVWSNYSHQIVQTCNSSPSSKPPPSEACMVSVIITNNTCLNTDGTQSSLTPGIMTATGCGGDEQKATIRAKANFSQYSCISEGDIAASGCCTYSKQTILGCLCK